MKQIGLSYFTDIHLTILGLIIFFTYFIYLLFVVFNQKRNHYFDYVSELPLDEGNSDV